jgi:hypothetical protein
LELGIDTPQKYLQVENLLIALYLQARYTGRLQGEAEE